MNQGGGLLNEITRMRDQALEESKRMYHAIEKLIPVFEKLTTSVDRLEKKIDKLEKAIK